MHAILRELGNDWTHEEFRYPAQPQLPEFSNGHGFFFASLKRKPFVLNTHGSLLGFKRYLPSGTQRWPYQIYDGLTFKLPARKADAIVVSSRLEFEDALEFGIEKSKLHIIPMGVEVQVPGAPENMKEGRPLNILFVGRLARVRRIELLLQSVRKLSIPFHLTIVGGEEKTSSLSKSGYREELLRLCRDLDLNSWVTFTGPKHQDELKTYYNTSDIFVYPSLYENLAQPVLEAAAAGLPVIATRVGIASELIQNEETGFIVTADPSEICQRIEQLRDMALRKNLGEKIREKARLNYGWNSVMGSYLELYRSL